MCYEYCPDSLTHYTTLHYTTLTLTLTRTLALTLTLTHTQLALPNRGWECVTSIVQTASRSRKVLEGSMCVCVCVCVCERERERERECVCVC